MASHPPGETGIRTQQVSGACSIRRGAAENAAVTVVPTTWVAVVGDWWPGASGQLRPMATSRGVDPNNPTDRSGGRKVLPRRIRDREPSVYGSSFSKITMLAALLVSHRMPIRSYPSEMAVWSIGRCWFWHSNRRIA